tara:strand:- start:1056 stop:1640 length:585 start_codon:yes stop_codon:yes gene_type:complete
MASRGVNKVILVGNLGQDPEVRYMANQNAVANITVATSESWKDQQGQQQERTEWHRIVLYRRLAEVAGEYLRKGSKVYIEGRLQTRKWQDQSGQDRYTTEVVANDMQMLDSRGQGQSGQYQGQGQGQGQNQGFGGQNQGFGGQQQGSQFTPQASQSGFNAPKSNAAPMQQNQKPAESNSFTPDLNDDWNDDIPF